MGQRKGKGYHLQTPTPSPRSRTSGFSERNPMTLVRALWLLGLGAAYVRCST